jgi:hypothetical protein
MSDTFICALQAKLLSSHFWVREASVQAQGDIVSPNFILVDTRLGFGRYLVSKSARGLLWNAQENAAPLTKEGMRQSILQWLGQNPNYA